MEKLLILNPGSTSTKVAVYDGETPLFVESIAHDSATIARYNKIADQYEFRRDLVRQTLRAHGVEEKNLDAVVARGGLLPPLQAGAYRVNDDMVWQLKNAPVNEHASNLGAIIAMDFARDNGIPAYIYDGVTVDQLIPVVRVTGLPGMRRRGIGHNLNMRAAGMRYAGENGRAYADCNLIIVHLGGGISVSMHQKGRIIDTVNDEEGPFSPERSGGLPSQQLVRMAFSGEYTCESLLKLMKSKGGLTAYFDTNDSREIEQRALAGDREALLVYDAMALNTAKFVGAMACVAEGQVDAILLTGGIAYSQDFTQRIRRRVEFIAPVIVYPGENEMESLALGGLRVLRGQEQAADFTAVRG